MLKRLLGSKHPSAAAAMRRLLVFKYQIVHSLTIPPRDMIALWKASWSKDDWNAFDADMLSRSKEMEALLRHQGLWQTMTDDERLFIASPVLELTEQQRINVSWLMEAAVCLLWALQYCESIPPYDTQADPELLKAVPAENTQTLVRAAALRPGHDLEAARSVAELWHWRSRTRRLQEEGGHDSLLPPGLSFRDVIAKTAEAAAAAGDIPEGIDADFSTFGKAYRDATPDEYGTLTSIAMERHRALNWLCGYATRNRWDETPTDT